MYKHILIATDGSELAAKGLAHGGQLAKSLGALVTVVTVTEPWSAMEMASLARQGNQNIINEFEAASTQTADRILEASASTVEGYGVTVETMHVMDSHPAEGIIQSATDKGCDLIVMASHGRRGLGRLFLGSQAAEVLSHSKVPVLIIR